MGTIFYAHARSPDSRGLEYGLANTSAKVTKDTFQAAKKICLINRKGVFFPFIKVMLAYFKGRREYRDTRR